MRYFNIVEAPIDLQVAPDAFGATTEATIGGYGCLLVLPTVLDSGYQRLVVIPDEWDVSEAGRLLRKSDPEAFDLGNVKWGEDRQSEVRLGEHSPRINVSRFLLVAEIDGQPYEALWTLARSYGEWTRLLCDWLEVLSGHDADLAKPSPRTTRVGVGLQESWCHQQGDGWASVIPPRPSETVLYIYDAVTHSQWTRAVQRASDKLEPSLHWSFILNAVRAFRRGDFRRAVIDAATAVEIVVAALLEQPAELQEKPADLFMPIKKKLKLCRERGIVLPTALHSELFVPRNDALHEGVEVPDELALRALTVAGYVIGMHAPID